MNISRRQHLAMMVKSAVGGMAFVRADSALADNQKSGEDVVVEIVADFLKNEGLPGMSLAIAKGGKIVIQGAYGFANLEKNEKLNTEHRFRIASISKPLTSVAIFRLVEDGKLKLDDKIFGKDGLLGREETGGGLEKITLHHLLTHTSGGWTNQKNDPMFRNINMDHKEMITWTLKNQALENSPGEKYAYSNFGYCLVGRIIERLTGQSYDEYVRHNILRSCGAEAMTIAGKMDEPKDEHEVVYYQDNKPITNRMNVHRMDSHGGWVGTPTQLVNFALRVDGQPSPEDILKPESLKLMLRPSEANKGYASGWEVDTYGNYWHSGGLPGLSTMLIRTGRAYGDFCSAGFINSRDNEAGDKLMGLMFRIFKAIRRKV